MIAGGRGREWTAESRIGLGDEKGLDYQSKGAIAVGRKWLILGLVIGLSFLVIGGAAARELRVPGDYSTIQDAVDASQDGDVILIAPGFYSGFAVVEKANLTILGTGSDPESVVISGTVLIKDSASITLSTLMITGDGNGVEIDGEIRTLTIQNCWLIRNELSGIVFLPTAVYEDVKLLDCMVRYNGYDGVVLGGRGREVLLQGNDISFNGRATPTGCGIRVGQELQSTVISDNIIVGNPFAGIHPQ